MPQQELKIKSENTYISDGLQYIEDSIDLKGKDKIKIILLCEEILLQMVEAYLTIVIGIVAMFTVYTLLLTFMGKINPISFAKKYKNAWMLAFSSCSSNVTMPLSMQCLDDLGVSSKIYSFSIPLGATINMDGATISCIIQVLFMCRIFNVPITLSTLLLLSFTTILLSISAPGASGSGIAIMTFLLAEVGINTGAVNFILPIITLIDFFTTTNNVTGDAVITTIVAKSEGLFHPKD